MFELKKHMSKERGFTLIELVIVLGVTGLIFSGLWGLLTSGSSQLQSQSMAQQYRKVIDATRKYVESGVYDSDAAGTMNTLSIATLKTQKLLSDNFNDKDAYGNTILIKVETIDAALQQWRIVVYSDRSVVINDKSGSQIASLLGAEGGFVYANPTDGCAATAAIAITKACGAFNSFALTLADFSITSGAGRLVVLAYTEDSNSGIAPYLYRKPGYSDEQRTMQDNMSFNAGLNLAMNGSAIAMGGGKLTMSGGNLSMGTDAATAGGGVLYMGGGNINDIRNVTGSNSTLTFNSLTLESETSIDVYPNQGGGLNTMNIYGNASDTVIFAINNGAGRADTFQAGKFIYSSDLSMKENLVPIANALGKILQLRGFSYDWKGGSAHDVGLIAQDVQKVFPELVTKTHSGQLGIDYAKIIAPVVEAIRQLKTENDALKQKIESMEKKLSKQ